MTDAPQATRTDSSTEHAALAERIERFAERATYRDHSESAVIDAVTEAGTSRPFVGALRALVKSLRATGRRITHDSIVLRLLRATDLDVPVTLELLRELLLTREHERRRVISPDEALKALHEDKVLSAVLGVARDGGRAALPTLLLWLEDGTSLGEAGALCDIAGAILEVLAIDDAEAVLYAFDPFGRWPLRTLPRLGRVRPEATLAFARRRVDEGHFWPAVLALIGLAQRKPPPPELLALATEIALEPKADGCRSFALKLLLHQPEVPVTLWPVFYDLPERAQFDVPLALGKHVREGDLEALAVLEHWLRMPSRGSWLVDECCAAFGLGLSGEKPRWLPHAVEARLVRAIGEAQRRGASEASVALALENALAERDDGAYARLGIEPVVFAAVAAGPNSRTSLMYAVCSQLVRGYAWPSRVLERMVEASSLEEKFLLVQTLTREKSAPDRWSEREVGRVLDAARAEMTDANAAALCLQFLPDTADREGLRQPLAWFARTFPNDLILRRALACLSQGRGSEVLEAVCQILRGAPGGVEVGL